jgi:hypothetical protein
MTDLYEEMPRSVRRDKSQEFDSSSSLDELVMPPSPDSLNVDDLLATLSAETFESSSDADAALAPVGSTSESGDQHASGELSLDDDLLNEQMAQHVEPELSPPAASVASAAVAQGQQRVEIGHLDLSPAGDPDAVYADGASSESVVQKPESFISKHKPKLVLGFIVVSLLGWGQYKKIQTSHVAQPAPHIEPYEAAIASMQSGDQNISPLEDAPFADEADLDAEALFAEGSAEGNLFQETAAASPVIPAQEEAVPESGESDLIGGNIAAGDQQQATNGAADGPGATAPTEAPVGSGQQTAEITTLKTTIEALEAERDSWKMQAEKALADLAALKSSAKPMVASKAPVAPAASQQKPAATAKPAAKPQLVTSRAAAKPAQAPQPAKSVAATKPRADVQYIGSFMSGDAWRAHVIVAGNVYELSKGQRIAGLTVDNVSGASVVINGHTYN